MRKLRRAEELAAEGKTGDQIAAELGPCARTAFGSCRLSGWAETRAGEQTGRVVVDSP